MDLLKYVAPDIVLADTEDNWSDIMTISGDDLGKQPQQKITSEKSGDSLSPLAW